jgi:predicted  nucleic acid-binding Zn-ribbon protein
MEILNKLKKIQSEIETANQSAYDSKQEIENLEYNLSQAGDYISDTSNYLEDIHTDIESLQETLEDDWAILERTVATKAIIQIVKMLPEIDRDYTILQVQEHFQAKKEETQEMKTPAAKSTTEETTEEN